MEPSTTPLPVINVPAEDSGSNNITPPNDVAPEGKPTDYSKLNVSFVDFQKLKGEHDEQETPASDNITPEVTPTNNDNKETPEQKVDGNKDTPQNLQLGKTVHARTGEGRDFTGIDPSHVDAFKRMSNDAFNIMKPIYVNASKLKQDIDERDRKIAELSTKGGQLPESYYSHPEAFVLAPMFRQTQAEHQMAYREAEHWKAQLVAVKTRKPVTDISLDKEGNLVVGDPIEVDDDNAPELEVQILQHLNRANGMARDKYNELTKFAQEFRFKNEQLTNFVREQEKRFFPEYEDKNYKGWEQGNALIKALPPELQGNILAGMVGRMFGRIKELMGEVKTLKESKGVENKLRQENKLTDPSPSNFNGGNKGKPTITYDMFQRL